MEIKTAIHPTVYSGDKREENKSRHVLFDGLSQGNLSHVVPVHETPYVVRAYNLVDDEVVTVFQVSTDGMHECPVFKNGELQSLDRHNTYIVLDIPGRYRFHLNKGVGSVFVLGEDYPVNWLKHSNHK